MGIKVGSVCQVPVTLDWGNAAGAWSASRTTAPRTKASERRRHGGAERPVRAGEALL